MCPLYSNLNVNIADITGGRIGKALCKDSKQHEAESRSSPEIPPRRDQQPPAVPTMRVCLTLFTWVMVSLTRTHSQNTLKGVFYEN